MLAMRTRLGHILTYLLVDMVTVLWHLGSPSYNLRMYYVRVLLASGHIERTTVNDVRGTEINLFYLGSTHFRLPSSTSLHR